MTTPDLTPRSRVTHDGRPAEIHTRPATGATGRLMVGIRYLDVERWESVPNFPNMEKPASGSVKIVAVADLTA